jgi:hypothetical protein
MDISISMLALMVLPCLAVLFAAAVYLTRRTITASRIWIVAAISALVLTLGVAGVMSAPLRGIVPMRQLVEACAVIYAIPFVVLTAAALWLRTNVRNRALGIVVLVGLFVVLSAATIRIAGSIIGIVNASG